MFLVRMTQKSLTDGARREGAAGEDQDTGPSVHGVLSRSTGSMYLITALIWMTFTSLLCCA